MDHQRPHSRFGTSSTWQAFVLSFLVLSVHAQQPFLPVETARAFSIRNDNSNNILEKRQGCISNFFSCSGVGAAFSDVCCPYSYTCALDQSNQPACCPVKYVNRHFNLLSYPTHSMGWVMKISFGKSSLTNLPAPSAPAPPPPASPPRAQRLPSPSSATPTSPSPTLPPTSPMPSSALPPLANAAPTTLPAAASWTARAASTASPSLSRAVRERLWGSMSELLLGRRVLLGSVSLVFRPLVLGHCGFCNWTWHR